MTVYLDTSAFVPLLVTEPTSAACRSLWNSADSIAATRLLRVEASAALAAARRSGRLDDEQLATGMSVVTCLWSEVEVVELDDALMLAGCQAATNFGLRGYDAVHCAAAWLLNEDGLLAASADRALLRAWRDLGVETFDPAGAVGEVAPG